MDLLVRFLLITGKFDRTFLSRDWGYGDWLMISGREKCGNG